jgi:hypothetical protein
MNSQDPNTMDSDERWLLYLMKGKILGKKKKPVQESLVKPNMCDEKMLIKSQKE